MAACGATCRDGTPCGAYGTGPDGLCWQHTAVPRPSKLGKAARRFWDEVTSTYQLRVDELRIVEDACREIDLIDRMESEQSESSLIAKGSQGQPVAAPLVQELRQHRGQLRRLLKQLKLPDPDDEAPESRSTSARDAALARWGRGKAG